MWKGCWLAAFAGALPLCSVACGDGELKSDDFDQSCEVDSDCVVVDDIGFCCSCEEVAINRDALDDYEEAANCGTCEFDCPQASSPACKQGMCEARPELVCAPGVDYACNNDECADFAGLKTCRADGLDYGACTCT
jgi:hypothetical protein